MVIQQYVMVGLDFFFKCIKFVYIPTYDNHFYVGTQKIC